MTTTDTIAQTRMILALDAIQKVMEDVERLLTVARELGNNTDHLNEEWGKVNSVKLGLVKRAMALGVPAETIMEITHR